MPQILEPLRQHLHRPDMAEAPTHFPGEKNGSQSGALLEKKTARRDGSRRAARFEYARR
jgi:hypothetical protein